MNWRDDNHERTGRAEYETQARARGERETPDAQARQDQRDRCDPDLIPEIHIARPLETIRPPAELPEQHDAHTASRMSIAQLRDRIRGMESTTRMKSTAEIAQARKEKPSERIARAAKLKAYRAELARRDGTEAAETTAQDRADIAERQAHADATREATARSTAAQVNPADVPNTVVCGKCGLLIAQDEDGDMLAHFNRQQQPCPARPTDWAPHRTKRDTTTQAPRELVKCSAPGCSSLATQDVTSARPYCGYPAHTPAAIDRAAEEARNAATLAAHEAREAAEREARDAADLAAERAEASGPHPIVIAAAKIAERALNIECRECHARRYSPCTNYAGKNCAPHGVRKADSKPEPTTQAQATVAELPPVPPAAAAASAQASSKRAAVVATAREETLSALDRAVEQLVREHTSGAVIDAAWAAGKRLFAPHVGRA